MAEGDESPDAGYSVKLALGMSGGGCDLVRETQIQAVIV
jgi:hypothetical protein